jgi:hypothetical protein
LGIISAVSLEARKITESFDRIDRSEELAGADSLLGIGPAAEHTSIKESPSVFL